MNEIAALYDGHEIVRREQAAVGRVPSGQRFESEHPAPLKRDLGLVVQFELPLVDGAQQLGCQQDAFGRGMVIGRVVENMAGTFVFRDRKSTRLNSSH